MAITFRIHDNFWDHSPVALEVDTLQLSNLQTLSLDQIKRTMIWQGKTQIEVGQAFDISGNLSDSTMIWQGDLTRVHWIGAKHSEGKIQVQGDAGRHLGSQMTGGEILVDGSVSDFAGVEMSGGTLRINGDGGNRVGARYPGSNIGMNRGAILVRGNVGHGVGENMRRGTIVIQGDTGDLAGWNMLAGTLCIFGNAGQHVGAGMVRGTIVCCGEAPNLLPTFASGPTEVQPEWMRIFFRWLERADASNQRLYKNVLQKRFRLFSGDMLYGGRGEVWSVA